MVDIVYGRARSGKTYTIIDRIKKCVNENKDCVLIVPEQYTLESEKELIKVIGNKAADIPVLSFTRLFETVSSIYGGSAGVIASDSDRVILMGRAVESVRYNLKYWARRRTTPEFCSELINAVNEFKTCSLNEEDLTKAADFLGIGRLKDKLSDIILISKAYSALLTSKYIDPMDNLKKLYDMLATSDYFANKYVFFDSFKGFTGQQYAVISRIISSAENVTFACCTDGNFFDDTGVFASVNRSVNKIISLAKQAGIKVNEAVSAGEPRYNSDDLAALEQFIVTRQKQNIKNENIMICSCRDVNEEAAFVADIIRKSVRENEYRYRDFVVIARNAELYSSAVSAEFKKCDVPVFMDYRLPAASLPLLNFADSAIKSVISFNTENILRFVKSGLSHLSDTEICDLENYVFIWRIEAKNG